MRKFLYGLVASFFVMMGIFVIGSMIEVNSPPRAYEDPVMTQINACAQLQERIQHATTEEHKAELMWWCIKRQYRTKP